MNLFSHAQDLDSSTNTELKVFSLNKILFLYLSLPRAFSMIWNKKGYKLCFNEIDFFFTH